MRPSTSLHARGFLLLSILVRSSEASRQCYFPDGTYAPLTDVPGPYVSSGGHSACCGAGAEYLSSGLCSYNGVIARGSCTDSSFEDDACPKFCISSPNASGGCLLIPYSLTDTINVLNWCCGIAGASCAASLQVAVVPGTVLGVAPSTQTVTSTLSSGGSSPTVSSQSSTITPAGEIITTITSAGATSTATYAIGTAACAALAAGTGVRVSESGCSAAHDLALGAGVGVPLGMALVAVSAVLAMYIRRLRIRDEKAATWPEYTAEPWGRERMELEKARQNSSRSEMDGEEPPPPLPREIDGKSIYRPPLVRSRSGGFSLLSESTRTTRTANARSSVWADTQMEGMRTIGPFDFRSLMTGGSRSSRATSYT